MGFIRFLKKFMLLLLSLFSSDDGDVKMIKWKKLVKEDEQIIIGDEDLKEENITFAKKNIDKKIKKEDVLFSDKEQDENISIKGDVSDENLSYNEGPLKTTLEEIIPDEDIFILEDTVIPAKKTYRLIKENIIKESIALLSTVSLVVPTLDDKKVNKEEKIEENKLIKNADTKVFVVDDTIDVNEREKVENDKEESISNSVVSEKIKAVISNEEDVLINGTPEDNEEKLKKEKPKEEELSITEQAIELERMLAADLMEKEEYVRRRQVYDGKIRTASELLRRDYETHIIPLPIIRVRLVNDLFNTVKLNNSLVNILRCFGVYENYASFNYFYFLNKKSCVFKTGMVLEENIRHVENIEFIIRKNYDISNYEVADVLRKLDYIKNDMKLRLLEMENKQKMRERHKKFYLFKGKPKNTVR